MRDQRELRDWRRAETLVDAFDAPATRRMTVQQLIDRLRALDPGLPVVMPAETGGRLCAVEEAFVDAARICDGLVLPATESDEGWVDVVRLFGPEEGAPMRQWR